MKWDLAISSGANTLIVGGQARLPKELSAVEVFQVVVEVDRDTSKVLEASFSCFCLNILNFIGFFSKRS